MSELETFVERFGGDPRWADAITEMREIPARPAVYGCVSNPSEAIESILSSIGIERLYSHQAEAVDLLRRGRNTVVATSTASGKSLCYHLPAIEAAVKDRTALYVFPTKALAQDQLRSLGELAPAGMDGRIGIYDGDTPKVARYGLRQSCGIILTNPDMIHMSMLGAHRGWRSFLSRLSYVVIDEAHMYRGVFGSHVAFALRRLRRVCAAYGASPTFALSTATLANAREHAENLVGVPFDVVDSDGSPSGPKRFALLSALHPDGRSFDSNEVSASIAAELIGREVKTMTFGRSRGGVERLADMIKFGLVSGHKGHMLNRVESYRGGYLPDERRAIERGFRSGRFLGLTTTNAMELGVDVGGLDATVLSGYPGTISSVWQQAGRSGRSGELAFAALVGRDSPIDEYYVRNGSALFDAPCENALVSVDNPAIAALHLRCAAAEIPLSRSDFAIFGEDVVRGAVATGGADFECDRRTLKRRYIGDRNKLLFGLRGADDERIRVMVGNSERLLETAEAEQAFRELYPGAIYMHRGQSYLVEGSARDGMVDVRPVPRPRFYTRALLEVDVDIIRRERRRRAGGVSVCYGKVNLVTTRSGYRKILIRGNTDLETVFAEPVIRSIETTGVWFESPLRGVLVDDEALDSAANVMRFAVATLAMCDPSDIVCVASGRRDEMPGGGLFAIDGYAGGVGIAEYVYENVEAVWERMARMALSCPCVDGCPRCVLGEDNDRGAGKIRCLNMLRWLVGKELWRSADGVAAD